MPAWGLLYWAVQGAAWLFLFTAIAGRIQRGHRRNKANNHRGAADGAGSIATASTTPQPFEGASRTVSSGTATEDPGEGPSGSLAPDLIEPLVGFRAWQVDEHGVLHSCMRSSVWLPRKPLRAKCLFNPGVRVTHEPLIVPHDGCTCGVYAVKHEFGMQFGADVKAHVWGTVKLWGKVVDGERGYRAEYAYPADLVLIWDRMMWDGSTTRGMPRDKAEQLRAMIQENYGVPVRLGRQEEVMAVMKASMRYRGFNGLFGL